MAKFLKASPTSPRASLAAHGVASPQRHAVGTLLVSPTRDTGNRHMKTKELSLFAESLSQPTTFKSDRTADSRRSPISNKGARELDFVNRVSGTPSDLFCQQPPRDTGCCHMVPTSVLVFVIFAMGCIVGGACVIIAQDEASASSGGGVKDSNIWCLSGSEAFGAGAGRCNQTGRASVNQTDAKEDDNIAKNSSVLGFVALGQLPHSSDMAVAVDDVAEGSAERLVELELPSEAPLSKQAQRPSHQSCAGEKLRQSGCRGRALKSKREDKGQRVSVEVLLLMIMAIFAQVVVLITMLFPALDGYQ